MTIEIGNPVLYLSWDEVVGIFEQFCLCKIGQEISNFPREYEKYTTEYFQYRPNSFENETYDEDFMNAFFFDMKHRRRIYVP